MGGGREAKVGKEQNKRHGCACGIAHDHLAVLSVVRKKQNGHPGQESARYSTKTTAYGKGGGYADQTPEEDSIDSIARVLPEDLIDGGQRQKGEAGWVARRVCGAVYGDSVSPFIHEFSEDELAYIHESFCDSAMPLIEMISHFNEKAEREAREHSLAV